MILTWPEIIGLINLYLTSRQLYGFIALMVGLLTTQIIKHFMIRRRMGLKIQYNFPNNEYDKKNSLAGVYINASIQFAFLLIGSVILIVNFNDVSDWLSLIKC